MPAPISPPYSSPPMLNVAPGATLNQVELIEIYLMAEHAGHEGLRDQYGTGIGRALEQALRTDPELRRQVEEFLGGPIDVSVADGRIVFLGPPTDAGSTGPASSGDGGRPRAPATDMSPRGTEEARSVDVRTSPRATASSEESAPQAPTFTLPPMDLSFLDDPTLDIETKLLMYFAQMSDRTEAEMDALMRGGAPEPEEQPAESHGRRRRSNGVLGAIMGVIDGAGTAVAGAFGGPAAAAAAHAALGGLSTLAASASGGSGAGSGSSGTNSSSSSGESEGIKLARLQQLMAKQQEFAAMLSNISSSFHQTRMGFINNIRG